MNFQIPLSFVSGFIILCWAGVKNQAGLVVFDVFYGFILAAAQGMLPPALASLTEDLSKMGVRMGMVYSLIGFAVLIGNPLAGVLVSADGGRYLYAQMYAGSALILGAALLVAARVSKTGWKVWVRI